MFRFLRPQVLFNNCCTLYNVNFRVMSTIVEPLQESIEMPASTGIKRPLTEGEESIAQKQKVDESIVRVKKRNFAMLLGYLGKDYYGMQRNPCVQTIEEELLSAMLKANLITTTGPDIMQSINFQRAARTDKGVSAVRQVVSLKLPENPSKESINEHLPENIRVFGIKRVTKGFNSKNQCNARTYSYTLPTYALLEEDPEQIKKIKEDYVNNEMRLEQLITIDGKSHTEYRISPERVDKLTKMLKLFEGTRHFHNFTAKVKPLDPRGKRFIMSFTCSEPFIYKGMEFITLEVKGQSFMLHQIRKMVAMVIGLMRNLASEDDFAVAFNADRVDIPIAPGLGLVLNHVHYDFYNRRYGSDGIHEPLEWLECEDEVKAFAENCILKHIVETEANEKPMLEWLGALTLHSFSLREYSRFNIPFGSVPNLKNDSVVSSPTDSAVTSATDSAVTSANDSTVNSATDSAVTTANDSTVNSTTDSAIGSATDSTSPTSSTADSTKSSTKDSMKSLTNDSMSSINESTNVS